MVPLADVPICSLYCPNSNRCLPPGVLGQRHAVLRERNPQDGRGRGLRDASAQPHAGPDGKRPGSAHPDEAEPGADVPARGPPDQPEPRLPRPWDSLLPVAQFPGNRGTFNLLMPVRYDLFCM